MKILLALASIAQIASAQINTCAFPLTCSGGTIRHAAQDGTMHLPRTFGQNPGNCLLTNGASADAFWGSCPGASGGLDTAHVAALIGDSLTNNAHHWITSADSVRASHIADSAKKAGSAPPSGAAGGDLTGGYPNPSVYKILGTPVYLGSNGSLLYNGATITTGVPDSARAASISDSAKRTWHTSNAIPKGNGSTGLTASSLTDNGTTVSTSEPITSTAGGDGPLAPFYANSGVPTFAMHGTLPGTNAKNWEMTSAPGGSWGLWAFDDAWSTGTEAIQVDRSGATPTLTTIVPNLRLSAGLKVATVDTVGSGTGLVASTGGVRSTLSGTNIALGNGTTIPQSTFQAALSGGAAGVLTKWSGSSTLGNAAYSDLQTTFGTQGMQLFFAGPATGANAIPRFRSIVNTDLSSVVWGGSLAGTGPNPDVRAIWGLSVPSPTAGLWRYNGSAYVWDATSYLPVNNPTYTGIMTGPKIITDDPAGSVSDMQLASGGSLRWIIRKAADAETGANAGSTFQIVARDDAGASIDAPISIVRAAGGLFSTPRPFSTTATGTGTAISAPNGDISTGGEIILTSSTSISGAGIYTQPFITTNAIQYYDGGGTFTLTAPSASGLAGKRFTICNRAASIIGFPTGSNAYYTSPGPLVPVGTCIDMLSDGTKWMYH